MTDPRRIVVYCASERDMSDLANLVLSRQGFQVTVTSDDQICVDKITETKPDVILLVLKGNEADHLPALWSARELQTNRIPVVAIADRSVHFDPTGKAFQEMNDWIWLKIPFGPNELVHKVKQALKTNEPTRSR